MLKRLSVAGFKSLHKVAVDVPLFTVLFGPNAAGKSNLLDAGQALSRIGTGRTLAEALGEPIRGYAIEAFTFPRGGLADLLGSDRATFTLEADVDVARESFRSRVAVSIQPDSGTLAVADEYLAALNRRGEPNGNPHIEAVEGPRIRRKSKPAHPRHEDLGANHTQVSDPRTRSGGGARRSPSRTTRGGRARWRDTRTPRGIAGLLSSLALKQKRQLIVTTHSPLFCNSVGKLSRSHPDDFRLMRVRSVRGSTEVTPVTTAGPLFRDQDIERALMEPNEDSLFENLLIRGLLDD